MDSPDQSARSDAPRQRMLEDAITLMEAEGSAGWTLRRLAERLGTSHRMVIYHFGSLEGLLVEVVRTVERQQRELRARLRSEHSDIRSAARVLREALLDPRLAASERLFFELYAAGLQGSAYARELPRSAVEEWVDDLVPDFEEATGEPEHARADARLGLAVVRGLLLDYLATGDREAVTAAHERYLSLFGELAPDR